MDPSLILPILVFAGHLSLECAERIISYQTKREQTMQLLCLLRTSSRNGCQGLFKALKEEKEHKAHQELLEQLENSCESTCCSLSISSTCTTEEPEVRKCHVRAINAESENSCSTRFSIE